MDIVGIGLQGDLRFGMHGILLANGLQQGLDLGCFEQGGGTTAEINGFEGMVLPLRRSAMQFLSHGGQQIGFLLQGGGEMKVAIMAGLFAKRYMKIEAGHAGWED